jgi:hypothetical protein
MLKNPHVPAVANVTENKLLPHVMLSKQKKKPKPKALEQIRF